MKRGGYTLIEMLLAVVIIMASILGVYKLASNASANASVKIEQDNLSSLVDGIEGTYKSAPNFSGLSNTLAGTLTDISLQSGFNTPITVRADTVTVANDAFDVVYGGLNAKQCTMLVPALLSKSHAVFVGNNATIQSTDGQLIDQGTLASECSDTTFASNTGVVTFQFYSQRFAAAMTPALACGVSCAPSNETQNVTCPVGQVGTITQTRIGTCTGGSPTCPTLVLGPWSVTANMCSLAPVTPPTPPPVTTPTAPCYATTDTQFLNCPAGQVGYIEQTKAETCPGPAFGAWTTVSNTCIPSPPPTGGPTCTPSSNQESQLCPLGYGGSIQLVQDVTCPNLVVGPWVVVGNTCEDNCIVGQTCCAPSAKTQAVGGICPTNDYGSTITYQQMTSTCSSSTATPIFGPWVTTNVTGGCNACPPDVNQSQTQTVTVNVPCPSGFTGTDTYGQLQTQSRTNSYFCPAGTLALPALTYGPWGAWTNVGGPIGEVNTCMSAAPTLSNDNVCFVNDVPSTPVNPAAPTSGQTYSCSTTGPATGSFHEGEGGTAGVCYWGTTIHAGGTTQTVSSTVTGAINGTSGSGISYKSYTVGGSVVTVEMPYTYAPTGPVGSDATVVNTTCGVPTVVSGYVYYWNGAGGSLGTDIADNCNGTVVTGAPGSPVYPSCSATNLNQSVSVTFIGTTYCNTGAHAGSIVSAELKQTAVCSRH